MCVPPYCRCVISLTWILHICIYLLPSSPPSIFLNQMFIDLETAIRNPIAMGHILHRHLHVLNFFPYSAGFSLFGVVFFGVYAFYLSWCTVKGTFRIGLRIPFLCKIYPMEVGNTMMNAFVFNILIILICIIPVVQVSPRVNGVCLVKALGVCWFQGEGSVFSK